MTNSTQKPMFTDAKPSNPNVRSGYKLQAKHKGLALLELALALALAAAVLVPMMAMQRSQRMLHDEQTQQQHQHHLMQAIEGFVLARGRLPCPAENPSDPTESRDAGQCTRFEGWVPYASLGLPVGPTWKMTVANLSQAGAPAAFALTAEKPLNQITPQQLSEVVYAPPTPSAPIGTGPLPAIHLCHWTPQAVLPNVTQSGCGNLPTLSHSIVLVVQPLNTAHPNAPSTGLHTSNANRTLQFMVSDTLMQGNPLWLSFERLNWLWLQSGALASS